MHGRRSASVRAWRRLPCTLRDGSWITALTGAVPGARNVAVTPLPAIRSKRRRYPASILSVLKQFHLGAQLLRLDAGI
jgi:hypothetical protein